MVTTPGHDSDDQPRASSRKELNAFQLAVSSFSNPADRITLREEVELPSLQVR